MTIANVLRHTRVAPSYGRGKPGNRASDPRMVGALTTSARYRRQRDWKAVIGSTGLRNVVGT